MHEPSLEVPALEAPERRVMASLAAGRRLEMDLAKGLHDLCQPLTTLLCRLEIALMDSTDQTDSTCGEMRLALVDGLAECVKLNGAVRAMQERVLRMNQDDGGVAL